MEAIFTLENIEKAYRACRRGKRGTINALRFEERLLDNLCDLRDELAARAYHPSYSICFVQKRPKLREIFAADFRDRVVHHLLVGYLEPLFERIFIHDAYACRKGKGVHAAIGRLRDFLQQATANGVRRAWYLKADVAGFFMNVDKEILYDLICKKIKRDDVRWLARVIIFHDCTCDYRFKGNRGLLEKIPPHKTLFKVPPGKGLPIGNLSSQFFANVYLNELDQFVKRQLRCRYYIRYCDDMVMLDDSPERLAAWREEIEAFLTEKLMLAPNPQQDRLRPVSSGIDFLGYIVRRRYVLVRRRVVNHFKEKLEWYQERMSERDFVRKKLAVRLKTHLQEEETPMPQIRAWVYAPDLLNGLRAVTASYLGHFAWADSHRLRRALFRRYPVLRAAFILKNSTLVPRYLPSGKARNIRAAYREWVPDSGPGPVRGTGLLHPLWTDKGSDSDVLVFFPVGRFYEFYGPQSAVARRVLGLRPVIGLRGFREGCGFHRRRLARFLNMALDAGRHVALIRAEKALDGKVDRHLAKLFRARGAGARGLCA
jgi:retron-type reverse transcriptase